MPVIGWSLGDLSKVFAGCFFLLFVTSDLACRAAFRNWIWDLGFCNGSEESTWIHSLSEKDSKVWLLETWDLRAHRDQYTAEDRLKYSDTVLNGTCYTNPLFPTRKNIVFPASSSKQSHRANYHNNISPHITSHYINALTGPFPCNFPANISSKKSFKNISFGSNTFLKSKYSLNAF
jgi:hypothetical protein